MSPGSVICLAVLSETVATSHMWPFKLKIHFKENLKWGFLVAVANKVKNTKIKAGSFRTPHGWHKIPRIARKGPQDSGLWVTLNGGGRGVQFSVELLIVCESCCPPLLSKTTRVFYKKKLFSGRNIKEHYGYKHLACKDAWCLRGHKVSLLLLKLVTQHPFLLQW